ncbi:3-phytase [Phycisphaerales bacterium]|nr:3-phytase [Phycisphaerales bacterium]
MPRLAWIWIAVGAAAGGTGLRAAPPNVTPSVETDPVPSAGDAADDPAIWVDPRDSAMSLIFGTNKKDGLAVYDLGGRQVQYLPVGEVNNVDVRSGFALGEKHVVLIGASHNTGQCLRFFVLDEKVHRLSEAPGGTIKVGIDKPYGFCLYHSAKDGKFYAFVSAADGRIEQWLLEDSGGSLKGTLARKLARPSQVEGMAADDELGFLYASEEDKGVWRFGAEPDGDANGVMVDAVGGNGHLTADAEGIAIWRGAKGAGYLVVSSQGDDSFAVYERRPPHAYAGSFRVGSSASVGGVSDTDGLDITSESLGAAFPYGLVVVQDGDNGGRNQNFKLVPWENVARAMKPALRLRP